MAVTGTAVARQNAFRISVSGRFDFSKHKEFRDAYRDAPAGARYVVDLDETDYMDSSALGMLLLLREHAGGDRSHVVLEGCSEEIKKVLALSNFQNLFDIR